MKRIFGLLLAGALTVAIWSTPRVVSADGGHNGYEWPGWKMSSEEGFNLDTGPSNVRNNRVSFPMTHLVDGNPSTAWVWDDAAREERIRENPDFDVKRSFSLKPDNAVVADELWLMNGYNRRRDLFFRNDRVIDIRINFDGKPVKRVNLSDKMGWHKISLPRRSWKTLSIDLVGIRKGEGADNDICLSELALYSHGEKINFQMPQAVIYHLSYCCGGAGYLLNRGGRVLIEAPTGEGGALAWSRDGRRVAGLDYTGNDNQIWIADVNAPAIARRTKLKLSNSRYRYGLRWQNNRTLEVIQDNYVNKKRQTRVVQRIESPV